MQSKITQSKKHLTNFRKK